MKRQLTIIDAMRDPALFGRWFKGESWNAWASFLAALFGLPMGDAALRIYRQHTARSSAQEEASREAWLVVGRRGGKSLVAALLATFLACFRSYSRFLAAGERGTIMIVAADRRQARVVLRYVAGFLDSTPMLAQLVESRTKESIQLRNRITIEVHTASFRAVRGYTIVAAICDEIAFWRSEEAANPDTEILNGLRPGMATIPQSLLLCISSPYSRRGALWEAYRKHYGYDGDPILVWQADTRTMNPTVAASVIADAYEQDEAAASAEYGAQFRRDIESLIAREALEALTIPGRYELPPVAGIKYFGFTDPSGGSADSFTLAVAHRAGGKLVLDCIREKKPPFSPEQVVRDLGDTLRSYGLTQVHGDRYAGEWPREQFRKCGIDYKPSPKDRSSLYLELLPLVNSGKTELLDHKRLITQFQGLERRTSRVGKDTIDHAPGAHDDLANAAAGALVLAATASRAPFRMPTLIEGKNIWAFGDESSLGKSWEPQ